MTVSGQGFTRLVAQSARQADDRVIDRAAMGLERVGPDIFQSSPIMRCGARHRYVCPSDTDIDGMFAGFSGKSTSVRSRNEKDRLNSRR
jgi:hypothetical protein